MKKPWSECNKPHRLTMEYMKSQDIHGFANGKPTRQFFKLYSFFKKQDTQVLNLLHEFLEATPKHRMNMTQLFHESWNWNVKSKVTHIKQTKETDYFALLKEME